MTNNQDNQTKSFDLERRTTEFAKRVVRFCKTLPRGAMSERLIGQVVGSAGSVGANYREANDALGKKDFIHRMKIARKESKECEHWLELIEEAYGTNPELTNLRDEAMQLRKILSAIITKSS